MTQCALNLVMSVLTWLWQLLNSNFFTALAGAFAGAYAAQWIVGRNERRRRTLEEIRNTNAAIMLAFSISNTFCGQKAQHIRELKSNYDNQRQALEAHKLARQQNRIPLDREFEFQADFQTLLPVPVPIDVLRGLLFEKISVVGRPLVLITTLSQCVDALAAMLERRNSFIAECKEKSPVPPGVLAPLYFGLPDSKGHIDRTYPDAIDAIASQTDDCIFFSNLLCDDLIEHGHTLVKQYGSGAPPIHKVDRTKPDQKGLLPDSKLYSDWLTKF